MPKQAQATSPAHKCHLDGSTDSSRMNPLATLPVPRREEQGWFLQKNDNRPVALSADHPTRHNDTKLQARPNLRKYRALVGRGRRRHLAEHARSHACAMPVCHFILQAPSPYCSTGSKPVLQYGAGGPPVVRKTGTPTRNRPRGHVPVPSREPCVFHRPCAQTSALKRRFFPRRALRAPNAEGAGRPVPEPVGNLGSHERWMSRGSNGVAITA